MEKAPCFPLELNADSTRRWMCPLQLGEVAGGHQFAVAALSGFPYSPHPPKNSLTVIVLSHLSVCGGL